MIQVPRRRVWPVLLALAVAGCAAVPDRVIEPQVSIADIQFIRGGAFEQRMLVDLRIRNPNAFDLPLDGMRFDLDINDRAFASGYSDEHVVVPRLGETLVRVPATTTVLDLVNQMVAISQDQGLSYTVSGEAILGTYEYRTVPFYKSGTIGLLSVEAPALWALQGH